MTKRKIINDIILITAIVCLIVLGFIFLTPKSDGKYVAVIVGDKEISRYPLSEPLETDILTDGVNHLIIEDSTARISSADCPNNVCVNTGKISKVGETIVCLPHKVVIKIISE